MFNVDDNKEANFTRIWALTSFTNLERYKRVPLSPCFVCLRDKSNASSVLKSNVSIPSFHPGRTLECSRRLCPVSTMMILFSSCKYIRCLLVSLSQAFSPVSGAELLATERRVQICGSHRTYVPFFITRRYVYH